MIDNGKIIRDALESRKVNSMEEFVLRHDNANLTLSSNERDFIRIEFLLNQKEVLDLVSVIENQQEVIDFFSKNTIKNRELFWIMWGLTMNCVDYPIQYHEQIKKIMEHGNRLDGLLKDRMIQSNFLISSLVGLPLKQFLYPINRALTKDIITVYRGFLVPKDDDVRKGTHITAMGSDSPGKQELETGILKKADLIVADSILQCRERGEIVHGLPEGVINEKDIIELGDILDEKALGRTSDDQITIADLTGVAVQDIQIAKAVFEACNKGA